MILRIANDIHLFGPHSFENTEPSFLMSALDSDWWYLGDIVDLVYCKKKDVKIATEVRDYLMNSRVGHYITGNHEMSYENMSRIIQDGVLLIHGDRVFDTDEHMDKYRSGKEEAGSNWFVRALVWAYETVCRGQPKILWNYKVPRAAEYAKDFNCHTVIMGHVHPRERFDEVIDGVRVVILERGYNEVEI